MAVIKGPTGGRHIPRPTAPRPKVKQQVGQHIRDRMEAKAYRPPDPEKMLQHIEQLLQSKWGPIHAKPMYGFPSPGPGDRPPIDLMPVYGIPTPPIDPIFQPLYAAPIDPEPNDWSQMQPVYGIPVNPHDDWYRPADPPIVAMYGVAPPIKGFLQMAKKA